MIGPLGEAAFLPRLSATFSVSVPLAGPLPSVLLPVALHLRLPTYTPASRSLGPPSLPARIETHSLQVGSEQTSASLRTHICLHAAGKLAASSARARRHKHAHAPDVDAAAAAAAVCRPVRTCTGGRRECSGRAPTGLPTRGDQSATTSSTPPVAKAPIPADHAHVRIPLECAGRSDPGSRATAAGRLHRSDRVSRSMACGRAARAGTGAGVAFGACLPTLQPTDRYIREISLSISLSLSFSVSLSLAL